MLISRGKIADAIAEHIRIANKNHGRGDFVEKMENGILILDLMFESSVIL